MAAATQARKTQSPFQPELAAMLFVVFFGADPAGQIASVDVLDDDKFQFVLITTSTFIASLRAGWGPQYDLFSFCARVVVVASLGLTRVKQKRISKKRSNSGASSKALCPAIICSFYMAHMCGATSNHR